MYNRPFFSRNATTEDKIVGTLGLLIVYGFLLYLSISFIIDNNEKHQKETTTSKIINQQNNMDASELLIEPYPVVKPGGQHVGIVSSAVQVTHIPTNLKVICSHEWSQNKNKMVAIGMIEHALRALSKII